MKRSKGKGRGATEAQEGKKGIKKGTEREDWESFRSLQAYIQRAMAGSGVWMNGIKVSLTNGLEQSCGVWR